MAKAIDAHLHPPDIVAAVARGMPELAAWLEQSGGDRAVPSIDDAAARYRELDILGVVLPIDTRTSTGQPAISNESVATIVQRFPDTFVGFGSVDPWMGRLAITEAERAVQLGLKGLKFAPGVQRFRVNDKRFFALWERCQELDVPIVIHTGVEFMGSGLPGGGGFRQEYNRPVPYVDDLAASFPHLTIIMAHPAWPWEEEQMAVMQHKGNVCMDLSARSPKRLSPSLLHRINTSMQDKVLFGSDYPALDPGKWLRHFAETPIKDEVRPKILYENAKRLLKL